MYILFFTDYRDDKSKLYSACSTARVHNHKKSHVIAKNDIIANLDSLGKVPGTIFLTSTLSDLLKISFNKSNLIQSKIMKIRKRRKCLETRSATYLWSQPWLFLCYKHKQTLVSCCYSNSSFNIAVPCC